MIEFPNDDDDDDDAQVDNCEHLRDILKGEGFQVTCKGVLLLAVIALAMARNVVKRTL